MYMYKYCFCSITTRDANRVLAHWVFYFVVLDTSQIFSYIYKYRIEYKAQL